MITFTIWTILGSIGIILLLVYFKTKNAVWGGFTLGLIVGIVIAIIRSDNLYIVKTAIVGTILGFIAELLGILSNRIKNR